MKLKRDTWVLLAILGVAAAIILYKINEAKKTSSLTGSQPVSIVPVVPSEKKKWEDRERMMPLVERISNDPSFKHSCDVVPTRSPDLPPLIEAERFDMRDRCIADRQRSAEFERHLQGANR